MGSKTEQEPLHILFFPFLTTGHTIPMVDMAKLFAARGARATIVTIPANASIIRSSIDHSPDAIAIHLIPSPGHLVGLPKNSSDVNKDITDMLLAVKILAPSFDEALAELRPDYTVTDSFFPWTMDAAAAHGIPRLAFDASCLFSLCVQGAFERNWAAMEAHTGASLIIPGLPHRIEMLKSQLPDDQNFAPEIHELFREIREADSRSYGFVVNSFYELEPEYADYYRTVLGGRAWLLGPVSLCNRDDSDKSARGNTVSIDTDKCINWLAGRERGSVLYVCFGSLVQFTPAQLREIAIGLENAGHPFIWVMRKGGISEWMPEGYEERMEGRGLVVRGWAPQVLILGHEAVGGFMTHCGWNSCLEGVCAGVPMATWPQFNEQFYNERLIVEVLGSGVAVGVKDYAVSVELNPVLGAETVGRAVGRLMGGGEEAEGRRRKAAELGEKARRAMEEGGSSYLELGNLIKELMDRRSAASAAAAKNNN